MTGFDVRAAVRAVLDETDLTSPEEVAAKVVESIPAKELRAALALVLRDYVRIEMGRVRRVPIGTVPVGPVSKANISAKVQSIRAAHERWLRERVFVGDSTWIMLGDCSYENLKYLQAERMENAARSVVAAERFGQLADLVKLHKVARVADLPPSVIGAAEWQAAA